MAEYGLIKSFEIDDGQLDGMTLQDAFVLGYELATIDELVKQPAPIHRMVHADNRHRIEKSVQDAGRHFELKWMPNDPSEAWMELQVAPID